MRRVFLPVGMTALLFACATVDLDTEVGRHEVDKLATAAMAGHFSALACYSTPKYVSPYSKSPAENHPSAVHLAKELNVAGQSADSVDVSLDSSGNLQTIWKRGDTIVFEYSHHVAGSPSARESGMFELDVTGATQIDGPDLLATAIGHRKTLLRIFIDQSGDLVLLKSTEGAGVALIGFLLPIPFTEQTTELAVFPRISPKARVGACSTAVQRGRSLDSKHNEP